MEGGMCSVMKGGKHTNEGWMARQGQEGREGGAIDRLASLSEDG